MQEVYVVAAHRTAVGSFNGSLSTLTAPKIGEVVIREMMNKYAIASEMISDIILGQVLTAGSGQNPARQTAIFAGIDHLVAAITINQVCGSGLRAMALGAQAIKAGDADFMIVGGQESMTNAPHASFIRSGVKMGDAKLIDTMIYDGLWDAFNNYHMGITAENIAKKFSISREEQDEFAVASQIKAEKASESGKFIDEIIPVTIKAKTGDIIFAKDEFIRPGTKLENLAKLKPAFDKDGTVTAGNASGINDGAAILFLASEEEVKKRNLKPIARIVASSTAGVDPAIMGTGPIAAVTKLLKKINWKTDDLDLIEANEAFAAQAIAVNKELKFDPTKVNVNGGAIAIGHPIGASGARIAVTLLHEMIKRKAKRGLATLCIGGGMGVATCFELL